MCDLEVKQTASLFVEEVGNQRERETKRRAHLCKLAQSSMCVEADL